MYYYNKAVECMTKQKKKAMQSERLISVVKGSTTMCPLTEAKMYEIKLKPSDIKSIDDLYKLPFTTKSDLRNNYPFGMFASPKEDIVRLHASSGTTGKLTVAGYTKKDIDDWAECCARALAAIEAKKARNTYSLRLRAVYRRFGNALRRRAFGRNRRPSIIGQHPEANYAYERLRGQSALLHPRLMRYTLRMRLRRWGLPRRLQP